MFISQTSEIPNFHSIMELLKKDWDIVLKKLPVPQNRTYLKLLTDSPDPKLGASDGHRFSLKSAFSSIFLFIYHAIFCNDIIACFLCNDKKQENAS